MHFTVQFQNQLGAYPLYRNYTSRRIKWVIPNSLGQLSSLVVQELNENSWEGVITEAQFANLSSLKQLSVTKSTPNVSLVLLLFSSPLPLFPLSTCAPPLLPTLACVGLGLNDNGGDQPLCKIELTLTS